MKGAVVVAAIRGQYWQAIGMVPGTNQVIRGGFARGVGAVRLESMGF